MPNRRDLIKLAPLAAVAGLAGASTWARAAEAVPKAKKPLRLLILGGTGFIGPHEVRYALARGHKVTLFNRGQHSKEWPGEVEQLLGDRNTGDLKSLAGREWDVCIDNPTTLPFWVRDAGKQLQGKVGHYIFISTVSVYARNDERDADETAAVAEYKGKDAMAETLDSFHANMELYGPLKALSEKEAEKWFPKKTTVIRPGLIAGPGDETDRFTYWPVRMARGGATLAPGDGTDTVQFIDARDIAEWTVRMAESGQTGTFNATGPQAPLSMSDMLKGIRGAVHSDADLQWAPNDFLDKNNVQAWSDMPVWIPGQGETAGFAHRNVHKAQKAGLTYRPLASTATDTLAWFRTQPAERQAKMKAGLTPEREKELLAALDREHPKV